jgi:Zn-finger nucleic acid-binding protein
MARFEVKVVSMAMSEVKDTKTNKVYKCKNVWYTRGNKKKFYVNVESVPTKQMKSMFSFPWSAEIVEKDGRTLLKGTSPVGLIEETDLAGKTSQAMPSLDAFI